MMDLMAAKETILEQLDVIEDEKFLVDQIHSLLDELRDANAVSRGLASKYKEIVDNEIDDLSDDEEVLRNQLEEL